MGQSGRLRCIAAERQYNELELLYAVRLLPTDKNVVHHFTERKRRGLFSGSSIEQHCALITDQEVHKRRFPVHSGVLPEDIGVFVVAVNLYTDIRVGFCREAAMNPRETHIPRRGISLRKINVRCNRCGQEPS